MKNFNRLTGLVLFTGLLASVGTVFAADGQVFCLSDEQSSGSYNCLVESYTFASKNKGDYELNLTDFAVYRKGATENTVKTIKVNAPINGGNYGEVAKKKCEDYAKSKNGVNAKLQNSPTYETIENVYSWVIGCQYEVPECEEGTLVKGGKCRVVDLSKKKAFVNFNKTLNQRKFWIDPTYYNGIFAFGYMETEMVPACRAGTHKVSQSSTGFVNLGGKATCLINK